MLRHSGLPVLLREDEREDGAHKKIWPADDLPAIFVDGWGLEPEAALELPVTRLDLLVL